MNETVSNRLRGAQLAIRAAVAAPLSMVIAQALALEYPIYAFLAAIIATDLVPLQSRQLGLRRLLVTLLGALSGAMVSAALPATAWSVGLSILVTILVSQRLRLRSGARMAGYICAITVLHFGTEPWSYAFHRFVETIVGVLVALAISYVPKMINAGAAGAVLGEDTATPWYQLDAEPAGSAMLFGDVQLALRIAVAAAIAIFAAQQLSLTYPIFACIAAVITVELDPSRSRQVGLSRILATLIGAACAAFVVLVLPANAWSWGAGILLTMLACQNLHSYESAKVAACVGGIVMLMHDGQPGWFALHRVLETGLGVIVALIVSYVPKLINSEPPPSLAAPDRSGDE